MMIDAVVDIGNSRIKLCRCDAMGLQLPVRGLSADDLTGWAKVAVEWGFARDRTWAIAATNPIRQRQFIEWLQSRGDRPVVIDSVTQVPITARVDEPHRVGIDRLLDALAAKTHTKSKAPIVVVDAGSAVTVDLVDERGDFAGGTIFPGVRLMALALRHNTAQLPLIDTATDLPAGPPGQNTLAAMQLGVMHAVAGGIDALVRATASSCASAPMLILTGGEMTPRLAGLLQCRHQFQSEIRSALTLEGIYLAASRLP